MPDSVVWPGAKKRDIGSVAASSSSCAIEERWRLREMIAGPPTGCNMMMKIYPVF